MGRTKVLLVELNEITWNLIDPLIEQKKLPTFALLKSKGSWGAPVSVDLPPQLDPWITWTTVYTGRGQADHNVFFLQQPPETIKARRVWEICNDHGLRVGVYGSLCSWPPQTVDGFYVPDTFAPDPSTYPEALQAIQELNLTYTRSIRLPSDQDGLRFKVKLGGKLLELGLGFGSIARIAKQLVQERLDPNVRWRRVALQPLVNFDFFRKLYTKHKPDFASFHTNHVAHYMHTYWKAMDPKAFALESSEAERNTYGGAIELGYRVADKLLEMMIAMLDKDTVLMVASSMGQKPFNSDLKNGKPIAQVRSLDRLLEILDVKGRAKALSTMSDQFNLYPDTMETATFLRNALQNVYVDSPDRPMFTVVTLENSLTVNLVPNEQVTADSRCVFPHRGQETSIRFEDLVYSTGNVKSGCHDPKGVLILYGPGIKSGGVISESNNLSIAPTLLTLLDIPVPEEMKGRVLSEALTVYG